MKRRRQYMPRHRVGSRTIAKQRVLCKDGPFKGHELCLSRYGDLSTLPVVVNGQVGRYVAGVWTPQP